MMKLESERLQLIPFAAEHILALIESTTLFRQKFGIPAAEGLREFYHSADVSPAWLEQLRQSGGVDPWKHGFAVVHKQEQLVIGTCGLKAPPDQEGMVEIAYGIVPNRE